LSSEQFAALNTELSTVMAGLVPAIHAVPRGAKNVDARDKPGHDDAWFHWPERAMPSTRWRKR